MVGSQSAGFLVFQVSGSGVQQALNFVVVFMVWAAIAAIAYWLLFRALRVLAGETRTDLDNLVLRTGRIPLLVAIVVYGLVSALDQLALTAAMSDLVHRFYIAGLVIAGFYLLWRMTREVLLRWLDKRALETDSKLDDLLVPIVRTLGPLVFFVVGIAFVLQTLGVDVLLLLASVGAVGLIVGLALQDTLSNLFSGIYLMADPPFLDDDLIMLETSQNIYRVQRVGLRTTELYDMTNHALLYVPNSTLTHSTVANITKPTVDMKVAGTVETTADVDPAKVKNELDQILSSHRNILNKPDLKLESLSARIAELARLADTSGPTILAALDELEAWRHHDSGKTDEIQDKLLAIRKETSGKLTEVQAAIRALHSHGNVGHKVQVLERALASDTGVTGDAAQSNGADRLTQLNELWHATAPLLAPQQTSQVEIPLKRIEELDAEQNALEEKLAKLEKKTQDELDRLLARLVAASETASKELCGKQLHKEAARIELWARNVAAVYAEVEVLEAIAALSRELGGLVDWLGALERGGLTRSERLNIRGLFGKWGGMQMLEKRRVTELKLRILRWLQWKEKDTLAPTEYDMLVARWERRLRILSRKLTQMPTSDEELLDTNLAATRDWLNSINFYEPIPDWKLPSASMKGFGESSCEFALSYYVDDIKLQNFERRTAVASELMLDMYEVFGREGIKPKSATTGG